MKQPDIHTYEAWLLDRLEGNLTAEQDALLDAFLLANPQLNVEDSTAWPFVQETTPFPAKAGLQRRLPPEHLPTLTDHADHLVAHLAGELGAPQTHALLALLATYPAIQRSLEQLRQATIEPTPTAFHAKASLYQSPGQKHDLDTLLIARLEGDLTPAEAALLETWLAAHPARQREALLYASTISPAEPVLYPHKAALRKRETRIIPLWTRWAAAAACIALAMIGLLRDPGNNAPGTGAQGTAEVAPAPANNSPTSAPPQVKSPTRELATTTPATGTPAIVQKTVSTEKVPARNEPLIPVGNDIPPQFAHNTPSDPPLATDPEPGIVRADEPLHPLQPTEPLLTAALQPTEASTAIIADHSEVALAMAERSVERLSKGHASVKLRGDRFRLRLGDAFELSAARDR